MSFICKLFAFLCFLRGGIGLIADMEFVIEKYERYNGNELVAMAMSWLPALSGGMVFDAIFLAIGVALLTFPWWPKSVHQRIAKIRSSVDAGSALRRHDGPIEEIQPQQPAIDRRRINRAYEYLKDICAYQGDGDEAIGIAAMLRQAAYDGDITIWGSRPTFSPIGGPFLEKIPKEFWKKYEIEANLLPLDVDELGESEERGHFTARASLSTDSSLEDTDANWHLHVYMSEVKANWQPKHLED